MRRDRLWSLESGPEAISVDHGVAWSGWRWRVANGVEARAIDVYVAAAALARDVRDLDPATAAARETRGRSAVEQMLSMPDPLPVVVCVRTGLRHQTAPPGSAPRPGSADEPLRRQA
jgi:hypothetical protein